MNHHTAVYLLKNLISVNLSKPNKTFAHIQPIKSLHRRWMSQRVVVSQMSDHPLDAVEKINLVPMDEPNRNSLPNDAVVIKVHSVGCHWVKILFYHQESCPRLSINFLDYF